MIISIKIPSLTLDILKDANAYYQFKRGFLMEDHRVKRGEKPTFLDFKIEYENLKYISSKPVLNSIKLYGVPSNEMIFETNIVVLEFEKDYLLPALKNLKQQYIGNIELRRLKELKYSKNDKVGYYEQVKEECLASFDSIKKAKYLGANERQLAIEGIQDILDVLNEKINNFSSIEFKKIPFTLSRDEMAVVFGRMLSNGIITGLNPPELAELMSKYFLHTKNQKVTRSLRNLINRYAKVDKISETKKAKLSIRFNKLFNN
ncbi:hypothetical protein [Seonamhaeicola marinus]|uniref:Uncharacterized protein n=1 Tax=Seonamhaeicola marinus TaxID=1912246 RepID=A0A5D0HSB9_9FLAO|nr:hypothetical protein [Seonamhaeicola marinus]TYA74236.1 hypothetical protein FUA24_12960 [Seonamhaeicola marinus]